MTLDNRWVGFLEVEDYDKRLKQWGEHAEKRSTSYLEGHVQSYDKRRGLIGKLLDRWVSDPRIAAYRGILLKRNGNTQPKNF
jgi:hypothetical protein